MTNRLWKNWFLLVLGAFMMALPYLGFPSAMRNFLSVVIGFLVIVVSFLLARQNAHETRA